MTNSSYFAVHSAANTPVSFQQTNSLSEARQYLAERIQNGLCNPRDTMAIIEWPSDQIVYIRKANNTVESVLTRTGRFSLLKQINVSGWFKRPDHSSQLPVLS